MIASFYRIVALCLFVAGVPSQAMMHGVDGDMVFKAHEHQFQVHQRAGQDFELVQADVPFSNDGEFFKDAFQHAEGGSKYLGSNNPVVGSSSRYMGFVKSDKKGPRQMYFYSLIQPEDKLGRKMDLNQDTQASILWKLHTKTGQVEMLQMDFLKRKPDVEWGFETLEDIVKHH